MDIKERYNAHERNEYNTNNAVTDQLRDKRIVETGETTVILQKFFDIEEVSAEYLFNS